MTTVETYNELMAALRAVGIHPYVVNEKSASHGYDRVWRIYIPAGPERDAKTIWTKDDPDARNEALRRLVRRHCPAQ